MLLIGDKDGYLRVLKQENEEIEIDSLIDAHITQINCLIENIDSFISGGDDGTINV